jgi:hypothetical protein
MAQDFFDDVPVDDVFDLLNTDRFLASMAMFMIDGQERSEARLVLDSQLEADTYTDSHEYGSSEVLPLRFRGPRKVYDALDHQDNSSAHAAFQRAAEAVKPDGYDWVEIVRGAALVGVVSDRWRDEVRAVLEGRDVDNQAVGPSAVATWEGLTLPVAVRGQNR